MSSRAKKKNRNGLPEESATVSAETAKKNRAAKITVFSLIGVLGLILVLGIADRE